MIRSAALLARRVAGLPDRLARGFAVLALLVLAAAGAMACGPAQAMTVAGPACAVGSPKMAVLSGALDDAQEAERSAFDRSDLRPADSEILSELGLPRAPVEAPRPRHTLSASFAYRSDTVPAAAPHGSPHRPPRSA